MSFCVNPCFAPNNVVKEELEEEALRPNPSEEEPLEINYDTSSLTYLYQAIEDKAFMAAIDFLESNRPEVYDECRTWVTRYELKNPKKIRWSQLPLHAAIVFGGPPRLIELLVKVYPRACRCTDDQSMLPVHLGLRFGSNDAILWRLLKEFPEAINAKDSKGRFPLQLAAQGEGWKRGEIISTFEKNARLKIIKADADHRVQASEALLNAQISKNEQLEAENKALKEENEMMKMDAIKSQKTVKKVTAQRDHLDAMRLMKRKVVKKPRGDPRDKETVEKEEELKINEEEDVKNENEIEIKNEKKTETGGEENLNNDNVSEEHVGEKKQKKQKKQKKKGFLSRFRKNNKISDASTAKDVTSDGKASISDKAEDANSEENPASADDVVESLNNLESTLVVAANQ